MLSERLAVSHTAYRQMQIIARRLNITMDQLLNRMLDAEERKRQSERAHSRW